MKKISFNHTLDYLPDVNNPSAASQSIPKWYKKIPKYLGGKFKVDKHFDINETIKGCTPFLDSMMTGYIIYTPADLQVTKEGGSTEIRWMFNGGELISLHGQFQIAEEQVPEEFDSQPFKFNNFWQIKTPKGYSTIFMHPLNRTDLPFHTLSGVVETDRYDPIINFPFLIKKDFEGIIPAGTPIVQIFPFKRESWQMNMDIADQKQIMKSEAKLTSRFTDRYKSFWWQRKVYR